MKKIIKLSSLLSLILLGISFVCKAQVEQDTSKIVSNPKSYSGSHNAFGKFNYKYLRLSVPSPVGNFGNPSNNVPEANGVFTMMDKLKNSYTVGLEWGAVRHFMGLHLGTDMLKLGINSGWTIQGFGQGDDNGGDHTTHIDDTYLLRLGLGPQISFKPHEDFRVGVYYRFGFALIYSHFINQQITPDQTDQIETQILNAAYNGDVGLDLSWNKLSLGVAYSTMKAQASKNQLGSGTNAYTYASHQQSPTSVAIDPTINFNRFVISAGFAF